MKKKLISVICLIAIFSNIFYLQKSFAANNVSIDLSLTALSSQEDSNFDNQVANDSAMNDLAGGAAKHKGKTISLDNVHPKGNIKIYGLKQTDNFVTSIFDTYSSTGKIESLLIDEYGILKPYFNNQNQYVDSLFFVKEKNVPNSKAKNGWVQFSSGNFFLSDESTQLLSENGEIKKLVMDLGVKSPKNLRILSLPQFPTSIYFIQNNEEFLIPLDNGGEIVKKFQVYKMDDFIAQFIKPVKDYQDQKDAEFKASGSDINTIKYGEPNIPENLTVLTSIDLHDYFKNKKSASVSPFIPQEENNTNFYIIALIAGIIALSGITFFKKIRNKIVTSNN
jgi:hypothetical protein